MKKLLPLVIALVPLPVLAVSEELSLTADLANSSPSAFEGSLAKTLDDFFDYDFMDPTFALPQQTYQPGAAGFHGNAPEGQDVLLSYTFAGVTIEADDQDLVIDLYGRVDNVCCNDRDDNIDVLLFNGSYDSPIASITGLAIDNAGANAHVRAIFDALPIGTMVDRIRLIGHDSGGGAANNYFTHMETRAALIEPLIDEDNDTLPDDWEVANNLDPNDDGSVNVANGPDGDPDNDSFTNLQEFEARTDPMDDDSDDDNLLDGDEVAGAGNRPPTDPLNPDTDGDSLNDDVESNSGNFINTNDTGTNPTLADSDSDGTGDFDEVTAGTDPNDPAAGGNLALGKLGGYFTAAGDPAGSWGGLPATNVNDGLPGTISHPLEMVSADYYYEIDLGADTSISSIALTGRGFRDNCCAERLENPTLVVVNSTGDEVFRQEYVGQIIMTETFDLSAAPPFGQFVRVINSSGANYGPQLGEIEIFGSSTPPAPLTITGFSADPATGEITLTWNSQPGAQYSLFGSEDLVNVEEINDSLNSDGTSTTLSFNFPSIIGKPKYFFHLSRN